MSKAGATAKKRGVAEATETAAQRDSTTGRFLPGNSGFGGRPKGARSKLSTEFFDDFYAAWQQHGAAALKKLAIANPKDFVKVAAILMPKEFEIRRPLDDITDAELADLIAVVQGIIAQQPGAEGAPLSAECGERPTIKSY